MIGPRFCHEKVGKSRKVVILVIFKGFTIPALNSCQNTENTEISGFVKNDTLTGGLDETVSEMTVFTRTLFYPDTVLPGIPTRTLFYPESLPGIPTRTVFLATPPIRNVFLATPPIRVVPPPHIRVCTTTAYPGLV